ncbi:hypothetical protein BP6252_03185 [Coleophoma cylindrospora]|uniref:WD40 repeat-like protein n=1 Tax=Coleophoma cylindrospora TaxID=1849047 RepID=A0A3D8S708_9HELO|nr:hypothetical protein BP6252_03185 [Coleophoma cylindrospora]
MTKESLDSDRINYLIWRYLLESGYEETAVRLQKEWNCQDPQTLPFAPHVTNRALVSILNRGLLYNAVERDTALVNRDVAGSQTGFFGPLTPTSPIAEDEDAEEHARKRQIDDEAPQNQNGPPVKRARLSNGYENGFDDNSMDVDGDQNGDGHAYPSPEQVPSPIVVPTSEQAIQLDKPVDLTSETTFLDLSDDASSSRNIVLMQCEWNPRDPTILAAAGTDALARMWTVSRATAGSDSGMQLDLDPTNVSPPFTDVLENSISTTTTVTGITWTSDGAALLLATEPVEDGSSKLSIWDSNGPRAVGIDGFESPIICPRWNPTNALILVLSPHNGGALISVINTVDGSVTQHSLPRHDLMEHAYDIVWTSDVDFVVGGEDTLQMLRYANGTIAPSRKFETREDHAICRVSYDFQSQLLATASETGTIDIWDQSGQCHQISAHQGLITSLAWQPVVGPVVEGGERLLASAGEDGAISIWNARSPESKPKCSMTMGQGVVGIAFTPDGTHIAGATSEYIDIWKIDNVRVQRATWTRGPELGWQTPRSSASSRDEDQHCLCWNANGEKLAYGVNSMMAVINFSR